MEIIVTGGRHYADFKYLFQTLNELAFTPFINDDYSAVFEITLLIHGGATGADTLAGLWAYNNGIRAQVYQANWEKYGAAAGPRRNYRMLSEHRDALVVVFPGGRGTENCVETARKLKMRIKDLRYSQNGDV